VTDRIGFRTVAWTEKNSPNGQSLFLRRAFAIHEGISAPWRGRVTTADEAKQLLLWAKELNCKLRAARHYPHSEAMTRLADELASWSGRKCRCMGRLIGQMRRLIKTRKASLR